MQHYRVERHLVRNPTWRAVLWLASGMALGAITTFLLDPSSGRRRRAVIREKVFSKGLALKKEFIKETRNLRNHIYGSIAEVKASSKSKRVNDETLNERIRSEFGRKTGHSRAIKTKVADGVVTVSGTILAEEFDDVIACIKGVPGVLNLINNLEIQKNS